VAKRPPRRKAEPGNAGHVAPPCRYGRDGAVHVGQKLARGEALLTLEAMKMETTVPPSATG